MSAKRNKQPAPQSPPSAPQQAPHWWRMETMASYRSGNNSQAQTIGSPAPSESVKSTPAMGSSGAHPVGGGSGLTSARSPSGGGGGTATSLVTSPIKSEPVIYAVAIESTQLDMLKQRRMSVLQGGARGSNGNNNNNTAGSRAGAGGGVAQGSSHGGGFKILKLSQPALQSLAHVHQSPSTRPSQTGLSIDPSSPLPGTAVGAGDGEGGLYRRLSTTIAGASVGSRRTSTSEILFGSGMPMTTTNASTLLTPGSIRNNNNNNNNAAPYYAFQQPSVSSFHFPNDEALGSCENSMTSASYHNSHYEPTGAVGISGGGGGFTGGLGSNSRPHSTTRSNSYHHSAMPMASATYSVGGNQSGLLHNNSSGAFPNMANLSLSSSPAGGSRHHGVSSGVGSNSTSGTTVGRASSALLDSPSSRCGPHSGGRATGGNAIGLSSGTTTPHMGGSTVHVGGGGGGGETVDSCPAASAGGGGGSPASPLPFHYLSPEHLSSRSKCGRRQLGDSSGGLMTNTNFFGETDKRVGRPHSPNGGGDVHNNTTSDASSSPRASKYAQGNQFFRRDPRTAGSSMGSLHSAKESSTHSHPHHSSIHSSSNNNNNNDNHHPHNPHSTSNNTNLSDMKGGKPSKSFGEMSRRLDTRKNPVKKDD